VSGLRLSGGAERREHPKPMKCAWFQCGFYLLSRDGKKPVSSRDKRWQSRGRGGWGGTGEPPGAGGGNWVPAGGVICGGN